MRGNVAWYGNYAGHVLSCLNGIENRIASFTNSHGVGEHIVGVDYSKDVQYVASDEHLRFLCQDDYTSQYGTLIIDGKDVCSK